jgi:hypothetical protein
MEFSFSFPVPRRSSYGHELDARWLCVFAAGTFAVQVTNRRGIELALATALIKRLRNLPMEA